MKKILSITAACLFGLVLSTADANAQCNAQWVQNTLQGNWKVNNAGGQGFGGVFSSKPQVFVNVLQRGGLSLNGSQPYYLGNRYWNEPNPNGGYWCSFTVDNKPARIAYADNGWIIFEIGAYRNRNKVEMIRRYR